MRRSWIIPAFLLLVTAFPVHAASRAAMPPARRTVPTPCAVFTLDAAVQSFVHCAVLGVHDLNTRQRYGWIALLGVLLLTAVLAGRGETLPGQTVWNALLFLAAGGLLAAYGYLLTAQVI